MTAKQITVRVTLDLVIDPEEWDQAYGTGTSKTAITSHVRAYAQEQFLQHHLAESGAILDATETHKP